MSALSCTCVQRAPSDIWARHTIVSALSRPWGRGALRAVWARHARVRLSRTCVRSESASRCHGMGKTRMCLPRPALACAERFAVRSVPHFKACRWGAAERLAMYGRVTHVSALYGPARACAERFAVFALYGRDTHVSALSRTCVRGTLRAVPRHGRGPHVSALSRRCVRQAPRAVWARHARIRPISHPSAKP